MTPPSIARPAPVHRPGCGADGASPELSISSSFSSWPSWLRRRPTACRRPACDGGSRRAGERVRPWPRSCRQEPPDACPSARAPRLDRLGRNDARTPRSPRPKSVKQARPRKAPTSTAWSDHLVSPMTVPYARISGPPGAALTLPPAARPRSSSMSDDLRPTRDTPRTIVAADGRLRKRRSSKACITRSWSIWMNSGVIRTLLVNPSCTSPVKHWLTGSIILRAAGRSDGRAGEPEPHYRQ